MLEASKRHRSALRRGAGAARRLAHRRARQGHLRARPQRRRQDQPAARHRRPAADLAAARSCSTARTSRRLAPYERARRGIAYVPQGREIFPLLTVKENLETGFAPLQRDERNIPDDVFELFPVLKDMLRPARRRPLRRPAAAARHRPRAGDAAEAAACSTSRPRASSRRSSRTSAAPSPTCAARQHGDRAGRAVFRLRPRARRPLRRDGPRRGRLACDRARRWIESELSRAMAL